MREKCQVYLKLAHVHDHSSGLLGQQNHLSVGWQAQPSGGLRIWKSTDPFNKVVELEAIWGEDGLCTALFVFLDKRELGIKAVTFVRVTACTAWMLPSLSEECFKE